MKGREIVKDIMEKNGVSNAEMAHKLDLTLATMWARINSKNMKDIPVSMMSDMLRVLDYKILVVPSNKKVMNGEYEVTNRTAKSGE